MKEKVIYWLLLPLLVGCSVNVDQAFKEENFKPNTNYAPLSLYYNGHPIFSIGQTLASLDTTMTYKKNEADKYYHSPESVTDYICYDNGLTVWLDNEAISGGIQFSADNDQDRIFRVIGYWTFNMPIDSEKLEEAKKKFCIAFFPVLTNKIEFREGWQQTVEHSTYEELFELKRNEKLNMWVISYKVILT